MNKACLRSTRPGVLQKLRLDIDAGYVEPRLYECLGQQSGATAYVQLLFGPVYLSFEGPHNRVCRASCKSSKCCCLNVREITKIR